ncbi:hypothetical protein [Robertmurraya sp. FSL R5-0851]|uniref:hypothetical protein n=1 Tax=Robertmurraya sp. FSL R5-0851 TaxID=2921584 RepID=UPI0030FC28E7
MSKNRDIKELLLEEAKDDRLYRRVVIEGLEDALFTPGILSMHEDVTYSTVDAGKIIERSDSTIRNHFRSDLINYIQPEKYGKYYRLDYKSIFRLHIIFILMEKVGRTTVDLLAELGWEPSISVGNPKILNRDSQSAYREVAAGLEIPDLQRQVLESRLQSVEKSLILQNAITRIFKHESDIANIDRLVESKKTLIHQIQSDAKMRYLEDKHSKLLATSLKKSIKKPSFFDLFKKAEEVDVVQMSSEIEKGLKEKMEEEITQQIAIHKEEMNELLKKKEKLNEKLLLEKEAFSKAQLELEKVDEDNSKNNNLIQIND